MGLFKVKEEAGRYHARENGAEWGLRMSSDEELEKWATDPNCIEQNICATYLSQRLIWLAQTKQAAEKAQTEKETALTAKRGLLAENPFDPRTEISADAKHIAGRLVTHLWILFVLLPIAISILYDFC